MFLTILERQVSPHNAAPERAPVRIKTPALPIPAFTLLAVAAGCMAYATSAVAATPTIEASHLSHDVKVLSSDAFEGRAPNSPAEAKTVAYLAEQFTQAGLKPGGDIVDGKRVWTQDVPLGRFEIKGPVELSVSDGKRTQALTQGEEIAVRAAMNGARSVALRDAPLVFVGYGVSAPERKWDDFKDVDLKGKLAVVLINDPDFETGKGDFGGKTMTYYGRWTYKYEELARRGALGTLIVHETAPASYGWATVKNSNTNVMYDIVRTHPQMSHAPVEAWIQRDLAASLFQRAGLDFDKLKAQARSRNFKPVELKGVTLSARYAVDVQTITSKNVVAIREGSERPGEYVIYSGHWDHLGIGQPDARGDKIYNGAVDNATGIAALLELARAYANDAPTKRSVVFLAVTAEEKGLLGSAYYAANPLYPLAQTAGVINMDALTPYGPARDFSISGSAKLDLLDRLVARAALSKVRYAPDPRPEAGSFFRSDHFSFAKQGVPAISFRSGIDWIDGGVAAGKANQDRYIANDYHQPSDEWKPEWTFSGMARDLELLYGLGRELAEARTWPNWSKDSEFRAARDRSAGERK